MKADSIKVLNEQREELMSMVELVQSPEALGKTGVSYLETRLDAVINALKQNMQGGAEAPADKAKEVPFGLDNQRLNQQIGDAVANLQKEKDLLHELKDKAAFDHFHMEKLKHYIDEAIKALSHIA
ncbi:MAG: hypothetical protein RR202_13040 [Bacteroidales bacterium]